MNKYLEKIRILEKENNHGHINKYYMESNYMFAIAYALLALAEAIKEGNETTNPK